MAIETKGLGEGGTGSSAGLDAFQRLRQQMRQKIEAQGKETSLADLIAKKQSELGVSGQGLKMQASQVTQSGRKAVLHLDTPLPKNKVQIPLANAAQRMMGNAAIGSKGSSIAADALMSLAQKSGNSGISALPGLFAHYGKKQTEPAEGGSRLGQFVDMVA